MSYAPFNKDTASTQDRIAWALCQIIDDDAPMRWTRYRFAAECIARNPEVMSDLRLLAASTVAAASPVVACFIDDHEGTDELESNWRECPRDYAGKLTKYELRAASTGGEAK